MRAGVCIFTVIAALAGMAGLPATAAEDRYCRDDAANVVLYLDVTTPYDEIDKRALVEGIGRIFAGFKGGERLSIRTIEDAFPKSVRLIDSCVPHCASGGIFGDLFSDCTEGAAINDSKILRRRIVEVLASRLNRTTELPLSEIIRTLALSAPEEYRKNRQNVVFVFSDMIENSSYMPGREFLTADVGALIEKLSSSGLIPDLWQAEVHIFGLGRGGAGNRNALPQDRLQKLTAFWTKYFAACGATAAMHQNLTAD
ncbi:MAG: hypothetical protein K8F58_08545 [Bauldia sp.]|nr:hypothetical protein [Bauldia sp.]